MRVEVRTKESEIYRGTAYSKWLAVKAALGSQKSKISGSTNRSFFEMGNTILHVGRKDENGNAEITKHSNNGIKCIFVLQYVPHNACILWMWNY